MNTKQADELERYPKYKRAYLRAFEKMLQELQDDSRRTTWKTPEDVMEWWVLQQ